MTAIPEGTRIGRIVVGQHFRGTKTKESVYYCKCDCGRTFTRRTYDLHRASKQAKATTCGQGECKSWSSQNTKNVNMRKEFGQMQHKVPHTPDREKQPMCFVCYNQPWHRLPSVEADDGKPVCGPNLKCRGCGGRYSEEPANDRSVLGSSGALWENVG